MTLLAVTEATYRRISGHHDRRWHTLADNDISSGLADRCTGAAPALCGADHALPEPSQPSRALHGALDAFEGQFLADDATHGPVQPYWIAAFAALSDPHWGD